MGENYGPLTMNFDASGTRDPNGDAQLTYRWDFDGNGTVDETGSSPTVSHTFTKRGRYTVTLTVEDSTGMVSEPAKIDVFPGDAPPEPAITQAPADFKVGEVYTAAGTATDPDGDGVTLKWEVAQVHDDNHEHPLQQDVPGDSVTFNGPPAEGLYSTNPQQNYLEVRLTATDFEGLSKTVERIVRPDTVPLTFRANPLDLKIRVGGEQIRGQKTVAAWVGDNISVTAPRQQDRDGHVWAFRSWSDGGPATHTITAPESPGTYTATFRRVSQ